MCMNLVYALYFLGICQVVVSCGLLCTSEQNRNTFVKSCTISWSRYKIIIDEV